MVDLLAEGVNFKIKTGGQTLKRKHQNYGVQSYLILYPLGSVKRIAKFCREKNVSSFENKL